MLIVSPLLKSIKIFYKSIFVIVTILSNFLGYSFWSPLENYDSPKMLSLHLCDSLKFLLWIKHIFTRYLLRDGEVKCLIEKLLFQDEYKSNIFE